MGSRSRGCRPKSTKTIAWLKLGGRAEAEEGDRLEGWHRAARWPVLRGPSSFEWNPFARSGRTGVPPL
uniref:Uncharacterized protein n=1 Tax=Arundo donax TaxID=35708 RepID=A0A0A9B7S1_ARUDO